MRDGGDDGREVPPVPVQPVPVPPGPEPFDDAVLDTPNCPACLMRMEAVSSPSGEPYWSCTECGQVVLA